MAGLRIIFKRIAACTVTAIIFSSCASVNSNQPRGMDKFKDDARLGKKVDRICFSGSIDHFYGAADDTIVLSRGINKDYRVKLSGMCSSLETAQSMVLENQSGCARRGDFILISKSVFELDDGVGPGPDRCYIDEIYEWHKDAFQEESQG